MRALVITTLLEKQYELDAAAKENACIVLFSDFCENFRHILQTKGILFQCLQYYQGPKEILEENSAKVRF